MAVGIVNFVTKIGEWLWVPVKREIGYMVHYKRNMELLNDQVQKLEDIRQDNQVSIDAAKMNGEEMKAQVHTWMKGADAVITKAKGLDDEAKENKKCFSGCCPDLRSRYKLSKQAVKSTQTGKDLQAEGKFDMVAHQVKRPIEIESIVSSEEFESLGSMKKAMDQVMEALKDDRVNMIGVYGMGGVGKTTMVEQVAVQARKEGLFNTVIMAVVSQNPNRRGIHGQLAEMLAFKLDEESESGRAGRLKERILRTEKILIVLDDLWKREELSEIGIPSGRDLEACKSKIIFTTRIADVCFKMGSQAKIHLDVLSEEDSWTLFRSKAGEVVESPNFHVVAKKVAEECRRLPIALVVVARALGDKELDEWEEAARRLEISTFTNLDDDERLFKCIKLSYDYLKDEDAKSCFKLCCLFPEDSFISMEDLVKYGTSHGLFRDANTIEKARAQARSVTRRLKNCSLLLEGVNGFMKMHDVVRDMGLLIGSSGGEHAVMVQAGIGLKEWPRKYDYEACTAISLMSNEIAELPDGLVCPKLKTLLLQKNSAVKEIPDAFFEELKLLTVLDLSRVGMSLIPPSLGRLTNLGTLCLDECKSILDISMLGSLRKLEILSLRNSKIEELPQEIGQLFNLRMLDLTESGDIKRIPPKVISSLSHLEELYMQGSFAEWGCQEGMELSIEQGITTNAGLDELTCLTHLHILEVDIRGAQCINPSSNAASCYHPDWLKFEVRIGEGAFIKHSKVTVAETTTTLVLHSTTANILPDWFNKFVTEKAKKLTYHDCSGVDDILLTEYDQGRLLTRGLESLTVYNCAEIVYLLNSTNWVRSKPVFEGLVQLYLYNVKNLKQICFGQLPHGSLAKLKRLQVQDCENLGYAMLESNLLRRLQNLEILSVLRSKSLQEVFRSEGLEEEVVLRKLRKVALEILPELTRIWNGPPRRDIFHDLKILTVIDCKKLGNNLFSLSMARCLLQLEELWVVHCDALVAIIGMDHEGDADATTTCNKGGGGGGGGGGYLPPSQSKSEINVDQQRSSTTLILHEIHFPQLKDLVLDNLPNLTSFYSAGDAAAATTIECPSLQQLCLNDCPNMTTSISDFHSRNTIQLNGALSVRVKVSNHYRQLSKDVLAIHAENESTPMYKRHNCFTTVPYSK